MSGQPSDEAFARYASQAGLATADQLDEARQLQTDAQSKGQLLALSDALVLQGAITAAQKEFAEKKLQAQQTGGIKTLGNYKLLKKLGEGGMGAVYLAEDTTMLRKVALKVLPKKYAADPEFLTRFRREAKAAGKLNHVNIVSAFTVGEELGNHYYVMEYCEGEPLDKILKREGALAWDKAVEITMQIARGLQHAHEHGLIHRDIKPANIFMASNATSTLGKGTDHGIAKILDMGLSKDIGGGEQSFNTQTGMALGTPHYISPEQAKGEKSIDGRTDIYSLGATLYHLLTGQTPFTGSTAAMIIMKHLTDQIPNPQDLRENIPDAVVMVIQKMMAKDSADRYADCAELLEDLELVIDGKTPSSAEFDPGKSSVAMRQVKRIAAQEAADRMRRRTGPQQPAGTRQHEPVAEARGDDRRQTDRRGEARGPDPKNKMYIAAGVAAMGMLVFLLALMGGGKKPSSENSEVRNTSPEIQNPKPIAPVVTPAAATPLAAQGLDDAWIKSVQALAPEKQVDAVVAKLREVNPAWKGTVYASKIADGAVSEFNISSINLKDISPIKALSRLSVLECSAHRESADGSLSDLSPLAGMKLIWLGVQRNPIKDLSPLRGMSLKQLYIGGTFVEDLSILTTFGALSHLDLIQTKVRDLTAIQNLPIKYLSLKFVAERDTALLKSMKTLEKINSLPVAEFWAKQAGADLEFNTWLETVRAMPRDEQGKAVSAKLVELNPGFGGAVTRVDGRYKIYGKDVVNITPLKALTKWDQVHIHDAQVTDFAPLTGMRWGELNIAGTLVRDIAPLRTMPLQTLVGIGPCDMTPLKGLRLSILRWKNNPEWTDLSVVEKMPLKALDCTGSGIRDFALLKTLPLTEIGLDFDAQRDSALLKSMEKLQTINGLPVAEFWAKNPAGAADAWARLKSDVQWKRIEPTELAGGKGGEDYEDVPEDGGLLIGLKTYVAYDKDKLMVFSVQPIFLGAKGKFYGTRHGWKDDEHTTELVAKPGYAVGAVRGQFGTFMEGFEVTFMRIKPSGVELDPADSYTSPWQGGKAAGEKVLSGNGSPVVGIWGRGGACIDSLGLLLLRPRGRAAQAAARPANVPADAREFQGSWYKLFIGNAANVNFADAKKRCEGMGGRLAIVDSKEKNDFLVTLIPPGDLAYHFAGASDDEKEGEWKWLDGKKLDFTAWEPQQPNSGKGANRLGIGRNGWNDQTDANVNGYFCEWEQAAKATAVDDPARWKDAVNLMSLIDPPKDQVAGAWRKEGGALLCNDGRGARIEVPYTPPEEYDFKMTFTRLQGFQPVKQLLFARGVAFGYAMGFKRGDGKGGYSGPQLAAFEVVGGKMAGWEGNPTAAAVNIGTGTSHTSIIQVRRDGLRAFLDGKLVSELKTDYKDLSPNPDWKLNVPARLGVGSWVSPIRVDVLELLEINDLGEFTRPGDPAAKDAKKKQDEVRAKKKAGASARPANVPADAVEFDGRWYKAYNNMAVPERMRWDQVKARCEQLGGRLAMPKTKELLDKLAALTPKEHGAKTALGAYRENGAWKWLDGQAVPEALYPASKGKDNHVLWIHNYGAPGRLLNDGLGIRPQASNNMEAFICEWEGAVDDPARWKDAIELLPLVDPARDGVHGNWSIKGGELACEPKLFARIEVPFAPPEEYDVRLEFTRKDVGHALIQVLQQQGKPFIFALVPFSNCTLFELIDGKDSGNGNPSIVRPTGLYEANRRYVSIVSVRKDGLKAYVDGKLITEWKTDGRDLSMNMAWALRGNAKMGLGSGFGAVTYHSYKLLSVNGPASVTKKKIDLLKLVDLKQDQVWGAWTKTDTALMSDVAGDFRPSGGGARLQIPYQPPEEYDYKIVFTRVGGQHCAGQIFPAKDMQLACIYGGYANSVSGFELVNGEDAHGIRNTSVVRKPVWRLGQKHTALLEVRKDGTKAYFDGELLTQTPASYETMASPVWYKLPDARCLGITTFASPTAFHEIEVTEIGGKGTFTRPKDPAAIEAEKKRGVAAGNTANDKRLVSEAFETLDLDNLPPNYSIFSIRKALSIVSIPGRGKALRISLIQAKTEAGLVIDLDAAKLRGHTLRAAAMMQCPAGYTPNPAEGWAGPRIGIKVNGENDLAQKLEPTRRDWVDVYTAPKFVPQDAASVQVFVSLQHVVADAYFDDLLIEIDPEPKSRPAR